MGIAKQVEEQGPPSGEAQDVKNEDGDTEDKRESDNVLEGANKDRKDSLEGEREESEGTNDYQS